MASMSSKIV